MAAPIPFHPPPEDPREVLRRRLEQAPVEHAEALLAVFEIVQQLHDKGLLEIAKGALGSGEKVMKIAVDTADSPEVIQGMRNFMIMTKLFASLDPKLLEHLAGAVPHALVQAKTEKPLGLLSLLFMMGNPNVRRILGIATRVMDGLGRDLIREDPR